MEASYGNPFNSSTININVTISCLGAIISVYPFTSSVADPSFTVVMSIALAAVITFNGLIAVVLLRATSVAVTVRVPLMNLLVAALIAAVILLCGTLSSVVPAQDGPTMLLLLLDLFCSFSLSFVQISRILGTVLFTAMVFQTVTCGTRKIGAKWLIFSLVTTWVIALLTTIVISAPIIYVLSTTCFLGDGIYVDIQILMVLAIMMMILFVCIIFVPLLVCICVIVHTLCYIKRHTISEGAQYKKTRAKFAASLITGSVLNVLDHIVNMAVVLGLLLNFAEVTSQLSYLQWVYLTYIISLLSFIPTPILIVVFLKPVRKRLCCLFCSKYRRNNETIPMQQAGTPL